MVQPEEEDERGTRRLLQRRAARAVARKVAEKPNEVLRGFERKLPQRARLLQQRLGQVREEACAPHARWRIRRDSTGARQAVGEREPSCNALHAIAAEALEQAETRARDARRRTRAEREHAKAAQDRGGEHAEALVLLAVRLAADRCEQHVGCRGVEHVREVQEHCGVSFDRRKVDARVPRGSQCCGELRERVRDVDGCADRGVRRRLVRVEENVDEFLDEKKRRWR